MRDRLTKTPSAAGFIVAKRATGFLLLLAFGCAGCRSASPAVDSGPARDGATVDARADGRSKNDIGPQNDGRQDEASKDSRSTDNSADRSLFTLDFGPLADIDIARCPDGGSASRDGSGATPSLTDATFGSLKWSFEIPNTLQVTPIKLAADSTRIYVAASSWGHLALDHRGKLLWQRIPNEPAYSRNWSSTHVTANGLVSSAVAKAAVELRDLQSGVLVRALVVPGPYDPGFAASQKISPPVASLPSGKLVVGGSHHRLTLVDADAQSLFSNQRVHGMIWEESVFADSNAIFAALSGSGRIAAFTHAGQLLWERSIRDGSATSVTAIAGPDSSVIGFTTMGDSTTVSVLDRRCGRLRWQKRLDGRSSAGLNGLVGVNGEIAVLTSAQGRFLRIQVFAPDGQQLWTHTILPDWPASWPFNYEDIGWLQQFGPIGADNALHIIRCKPDPADASKLKNLLESFDMRTGTRVNRVELPFVGCVDRHHALLLDSGILVTAKADSNANVQIVGVQTQSPGLAKSPWPRLCIDNASSCLHRKTD